ncbi:ThiW protein [Agrilactobacillus composti DSM 18527 = JCM 14202]|uniref:ThiW protein n=2 Tax=Agrilactobacillus TaxID=2767875 RepID=X0PD93_9LACO|nr:energy coupling factor transporter S component ThiW [Agrilactobacillus composti]KRM30460.1 ThiW protein [Agrilactobacillus composti DSM 18527 = JCM 14202]GAF38944.1 substrate-specific component ThiW of predicted thiazole ECF transporter [Agrilactobacillus composti DSM 18527 = JCM 14202]
MLQAQHDRIQRLILLSFMIALDVVLSPLLRIEGMAPMSSVMNVIAAVLMGPVYATLMALVCAIIRMTMLGIPPLALTGAFFGALLAGLLYKLGGKVGYAMLGEFIGTGIIGSLISFPVMVWFTGSNIGLWWFVYTPKFMGASIGGGIVAYLILVRLQQTSIFKRLKIVMWGGLLGNKKRA